MTSSFLLPTVVAAAAAISFFTLLRKLERIAVALVGVNTHDEGLDETALFIILIRFTLISPYTRLGHARLLDKAPMARALRNPPSPRRYMATEPSPECASRHGAKGDRHFKHSALNDIDEKAITTENPEDVVVAFAEAAKVFSHLIKKQ
ncbi:hypothetical protein F2Q69_00011386 [Brassica cretica]|uniref:Uncharacterized protein n=1 Tax=Brassica cretica TaxID=69181 RepID=A0A8S9QNZ4_BRACR|nr:hypothetical protein F2Q69_00011386 [Brassica cretica]